MVSNLLYRPAIASDAMCLGVLATQVFLDTYATRGIRTAIAREVLTHCSVDAYAALLADPAAGVIVAERDRHLVAFAQIAHDVSHDPHPDTPAAELRRLYVQEPFTRRGIGAALLRQAEAASAARGARILWLTAWAENRRALAFYAGQGYADVGESTYTFEGEDYANRLFARRLGDDATPL